MKLKFRNKYLDRILEKYGRSDFRFFSEDELRSLCEELSIPTVQRMKGDTVEGMNIQETIKCINYATSIPSQYLPEEYWEESHRDIAARFRLKEDILKHAHGGETFSTMADAGFGWHDFKAGEERVLEVPVRWVMEEFVKSRTVYKRDKEGKMVPEKFPSPYQGILEVTDEFGTVLTEDYDPNKKPVVAEEVKEDELAAIAEIPRKTLIAAIVAKNGTSATEYSGKPISEIQKIYLSLNA